MAYISDFEYYENNGTAPTSANWGSYQYVSLIDIVNNFMLFYTGNDSLINNVHQSKVLFHAKRAIQEFNYDAFKNIKILELEIGTTNQFVMPPDYVDYVRISYEKDGTLFPLVENKQTNFANSYLQDVNNNIVFDVNGNVIEVQSQLDVSRLAGDTQKQYFGDGTFNGSWGWWIDGDWYFSRQLGPMFGLNPETTNVNGTYKIDKANGVINFSSDLSGSNIVLEYITDGMENGNDAAVYVVKVAEEAIYAYIRWAILNNKLGIPIYERNEAKRQKKAYYDNAKIRLIGLRPETLLMTLRNQDKWIK